MPVRRAGRRGLIGTMARTAAIAGTATAVSNKVSMRQADKQQQQWANEQVAAQQAAPQAAPAPAAAPAAGGIDQSVIDQLKELGALRDQGILTDAEFDAQKAKLLG